MIWVLLHWAEGSGALALSLCLAGRWGGGVGLGVNRQQCPPAASPLPLVVGSRGSMLIELWNHGISQVGRGAGSTQNHTKTLRVMSKRSLSSSLGLCLLPWGREGCSVPTHGPLVPSLNFRMMFWQGNPGARALGTVLRCWRGKGAASWKEGSASRLSRGQ